jgi:hypothetical protein
MAADGEVGVGSLPPIPLAWLESVGQMPRDEDPLVTATRALCVAHERGYRSVMLERSRRWLPWLALIAIVVGFANFTWFFAESSTIGDAQRGYVRDGHYYLVRAGVATEVSRERWDWSNLHAASLILTHPLALAGGAYLLLTVVFPSMIGLGDPTVRRDRVERIRASGPALASTRTGGRIGELQATKPLIRVDVHPGGMILTVFGGPPIGIDAGSLSGVIPERPFGSAMIRITHRQTDVPADLRLYLDDASPVAEALRAVIASAGTAAPDQAPPEAPGTTVVSPYPAVMKAGIIAGMGLGIVFLVVALPFGSRLGGFGTVWSIALVLIFAFNIWNYFIRNRHRW